MQRMFFWGCLFSVVCLTASAGEPEAFRVADYRSGIAWPEPPVVTPGAEPGAAPSDAIVLFDGTNLDAWNGGPWNVADGVMTVEPGTGNLETKEKFGSVQLHLEFATPPVELDDAGEPKFSSQGRGNSGVFFMNHYEVQVLDNYENKTYPDGQCGGIYKQIAPLVNVCKKPGEWQTYDIIFTKPTLKIENDQVVEVIRPAYITVILNGVLVVNHWEIKGDTFWHVPPTYQVHGDREPIRLQDHGNRMQFRNIWLREIPDANILPPQTTMPYYAQ